MNGIGKALAALGCVLLMGCSEGDDDFVAAGNEYVEQFHQDVRQGRYAAIYQASSPGLKANASEQEFVDLLTVVNRGLGEVQETRLVSQSPVKADTGQPLTLLLYNTRFAEGEGTESFYLENADGKPLLFRYNVNSDTLLKKMIEQGARASN
ncbi:MULTISPECIES: DUF4019 domain-containing protein [unclassified Pseudomonas]|jgi:hypothetical protein|uniref:DUF4019 domain-containing protein n=1 Tax=unclassified Pseudomonas TaxID=196821 RepID=UPI000DADBD84|nr:MULTISPECIES: DUF4019 domain-containing protein [unclassified Pseudomonas]MBD9656751.1 DUF4019 domain-containing protein [Pseudomonas sp. PDM12]PZW45457.1 uncharacterized protein DUF4019 [Pseudomonas sp. URMO17WK12:I2]